MITFPSVGPAVEAAVAIQRAIAGADLPEPIRVRIGLHAGRPIREGDDFFGKAVVLAARISTHARGGEILASEAIRDLAREGGFGDAREVEIKGLGGAHRVYVVPSVESP